MTSTNALTFRVENSCRKYIISEVITVVLTRDGRYIYNHTAADMAWPEKVGPQERVRALFVSGEVPEHTAEFPLDLVGNIILSVCYFFC